MTAIARARVAVSVVFLVNGAGLGLWIPQIPGVRARLGMDDRDLGVALLAMAMGSVLGMPLVTRLVERFGSRTLTALSALAFCAAMPVPVRASSFPMLVAALFAFGLSSGATDVAMNVHASRVEGEMARPVMSSFHGLFSLGALVGSAASSFGLARGASAGATMLGGALVLAPLVAVASSGLLRSADPHHDGPRGFTLPPRGVLALGLLAVLGMMSEGAVADWSGVFLTTTPEVGMTEARAGATFTLLSLTATFGRLVLGDRAVHAWGRRPVLVGSAGLAAVGVLVALAVPGPVTSSAGLCVAWLGLTSFVPILFSAAGQQHDVAPAVAMGAVATVGYVGFLLGPPLIGLLAHATGLRAALVLIPVACVTVAVLGRRPSLAL